MGKVHELGYVGISSGDLDAWRSYATSVLGHEVAYDSDEGSLFLKMDGHHHRLSVHPGDSEDVAFVEPPNRRERLGVYELEVVRLDVG